MQQEALDVARLLHRASHYAARAGASPAAASNLQDLLRSQLGARVLALATNPRLASLLVSDLYKLKMQAMYSQFVTGVEADFVLHIRRCPRLKAAAAGQRGTDSQPGAAPRALAHMRDEHPDIFRQLVARTTEQLQGLEALPRSVLDALQEFNGYRPPPALLEQLQACSVAAVQWVEVDGAPVAVGLGPVCAASNTETSCMQAVQAAIVAAAAAQHQRQLGLANQQGGAAPLDRTERLANSLGKMAATVEQLNAIPHAFSIVLMAGRRSTDLLHLVLQNLYAMQHMRGYAGTSSLLAATLLRELLLEQGVGLQQRQQLVGRVMGTHAHELHSMTQQLCAGYDWECGRRCGLQGPVCVTQLLSHLLFLAANGSSNHATALPDTFTTPAFVRVAELASLPPEFVQDVADRWGEELQPAGSCVLDLFRVWRLDSGCYAELAQLLHDTWQRRNSARTAAGAPPLPRLQLLHSNIGSLDDVRELAAMPEHIRPAMLGFGGLTDGFVPFDVSPAPEVTAADGAAASTEAPAGAAAEVVLPTCSLVMKAVQARLSSAGGGGNSSLPEQPGSSSAAHARQQACAVKLGDGGLSKAQTDPRLPGATRATVLAEAQAAAAAALALGGAQHAAALSGVLREAYVAVTRRGVLMSF